jgi:uncharacterized secreted protein with C-terminal beta-propeller domain
MKALRYLILSVVAAAGAGSLLGCDSAGGSDPTAPRRRNSEPPRATAKKLTLRAFSSCEVLEKYLEDGMVQQMRAQIELQIQQGIAFGGPRGGVVDTAAPGAAAPTAPPSGKSGGSSAPAPAAYTKTNTQVAGVDEADFVKNDGKRIFVLTGQRLYATQSWPPQSLALASGIDIEGYPREMFLDEKRNRVVVISEVFTPYAGGAKGGGGVAPAGVATDAICAPGPYGCGGYGVSNVQLSVVNVADATRMSVEETYLLPGRYVNARRVDAAVRIVLSDEFQYPEAVRYYPDTSSDPSIYNDKARLTSALQALEVENERVIRARTLDEWLPRGRVTRAGSKLADLTYRCTDFAYADVSTRMGLVTVASLNLDTPGAPPARTSVVAEAGEVYASQKALYIANRHWWWWPEPGQTDWTYVHKFDISQPDRATYLASGGFEGHIVDQFSMDEHDGAFRVATTIERRVPDATNPQNRWGTTQLTNRVSVLGERAGQLVLLGASEELAVGERITSARFAGKVGYVVTFRNVDPLFVFDLSNPAGPRKVGELKIPGFSTYIHPLDEAHLLTIGVYQPEPDPSGRTDRFWRRIQLAMFDVSNPAQPRQTHVTLLGSAYGWSEATSEHKAFNYFPERKLLAIPFSDYLPTGTTGYWDTFVSDLRVFDVDVDKGINPRGNLSMRDLYMKAGGTSWYWNYSPWIRRSVMASDPDGNEFVYAISDRGVRVANARSLTTPLGTVEFPVPEPSTGPVR